MTSSLFAMHFPMQPRSFEIKEGTPKSLNFTNPTGVVTEAGFATQCA